MPQFIRKPNDFLTGLIFIVVGLAFVYLARDYTMGAASQMGPAYFPTLLGGLLAALGAVLVLLSFGGLPSRLEQFAWKPLLIAVLSLTAFGLLVRGGGLIAAVVALVVVSLTASIRFRAVPAIALGAGLAVFAWAVFTWGLGLQLHAFGSWFHD